MDSETIQLIWVLLITAPFVITYIVVATIFLFQFINRKRYLKLNIFLFLVSTVISFFASDFPAIERVLYLFVLSSDILVIFSILKEKKNIKFQKYLPILFLSASLLISTISLLSEGFYVFIYFPLYITITVSALMMMLFCAFQRVTLLYWMKAILLIEFFIISNAFFIEDSKYIPEWYTNDNFYFYMVLVNAFIVTLSFTLIMINIIKDNRALRANMQSEIETRTNKLEKSLSERKKMISNIIHDLKAPISSIQLFTNMMQEDTTEINSYIKNIDIKSEEIQKRIEILRKISEQDEIEYNMNFISINAFIRYIYNLYAPDMDARGVYFEVHYLKKDMFIWGDKDKLALAFENLIYNSLSFTPSGGVVQINVQSTNNQAIFDICDTGSGIEKQTLLKIFDRKFTYRSDNSGNGLGLYIARLITLDHNAEIDVQSEVGKGTTFTIKISSYSTPSIKQ